MMIWDKRMITQKDKCFRWGNNFSAVLCLSVAIIVLICQLSIVNAAEPINFTTIVISNPDSFAPLAAKELARVFDPKISVVDTIPEDKSGCIILKSEASFKTDGYSIELKDKTIWIKGRNAGLLYGSYALLRHFGWEYYAPDCEKMPDMKHNIADFHANRSPELAFRTVDFAFGGESKEYKAPFATLRLGFSPFKYFDDPKLTSLVCAPFFEKKKVNTWHTNSAFTPHENKFIQTHPELYAKDRDGRLKGFSELYGITGMIHGCGSNPRYREIASEKVMKWLDGSPAALAVPVLQGDGYDWCECPNCLALDSIPQPTGKMLHNMADRQLNLVNEIARKVAQKYPDKKVIFAIYTATTEPPVREIPEPNVILLFCPYPPYALCFSHGLDCPRNKEFLDLMSAWQQKFPQNTAWVFDYPMNYSNRFALFFPHDAMYSKIRYYGSHNISGLTLCGSPRLLDELFLFVVGHLLWDSQLDDTAIKELESEFMDAFYGPAAPAMTEYLALLRKYKVCQGIYNGRSELSNPAFIQDAYRILNPVSVLGNIYGKRVRKELAGVLFTDLTHYITLDPAVRLRHLKNYCAITQEHSGLLFPSQRQDIAEWMKNSFGIDVKLKQKSINAQWNELLMTAKLKELDACITDEDFNTLAKKLTRQSIMQQRVTATEIIPSLDAVAVRGVKNGVIKYLDRQVVVLYGTESMSTVFEYEADTPFVNGKLILEALDHDKPDGKTLIEISVNNKMIFNGANSASKEEYTTLTFPIPEGLVKRGRNSLAIRNLSPAAPMANWFIVSDIKITPSNNPWKVIVTSPELKIWKDKSVEADWKSVPGQLQVTMLTPGKKNYLLRAYYEIEDAIPNKNYRVRFLVSCSDNQMPFFAYIMVKDYNSIGTTTIAPMSEAKHYELKFIAKADVGKPRIWFPLAHLTKGAQLMISDIVIEEQQ